MVLSLDFRKLLSESLAFYFSRTLWPTDLLVYYETGLFELGVWAYAVTALALALLLLPKL